MDEQDQHEGKGAVVIRCSPQMTGAQRRHLRALGHPLQPVVIVGEKGLHDGVFQQIDRALLDHELIKVKLLGGDPATRIAAADAFFKELKGQTVQILGNILLVYRAHPEEPRIKLPRAGGRKS
jgi:RNA-binding protein